MDNYSCSLYIPNTCKYVSPGDRIKIGRFEADTWIVKYGWYTCEGNRPLCGWYVINCEDPNVIKPLSKIDLLDTYLIEHVGINDDNCINCPQLPNMFIDTKDSVVGYQMIIDKLYEFYVGRYNDNTINVHPVETEVIQ